MRNSSCKKWTKKEIKVLYLLQKWGYKSNNIQVLIDTDDTFLYDLFNLRSYASITAKLSEIRSVLNGNHFTKMSKSAYDFIIAGTKQPVPKEILYLKPKKETLSEDDKIDIIDKAIESGEINKIDELYEQGYKLADGQCKTYTHPEWIVDPKNCGSTYFQLSEEQQKDMENGWEKLCNEVYADKKEDVDSQEKYPCHQNIKEIIQLAIEKKAKRVRITTSEINIDIKF